MNLRIALSCVAAGTLFGGALAQPAKWAYYDVDTLSGLSDGDAVTGWTDSSGNPNHNLVRYGSSGVTYRTNGVDGKPSVEFNQGQLTTAVGVPTPANEAVTVMAMFRVTNRRAWQQIIGQGHDQYWVIRRCWGQDTTMCMHVRNSNSPRASFSDDTDYVIVGRVQGGSRDISLYTMAGTRHSTASGSGGERIQSATNDDTKIAMGWSKLRSGSQMFNGLIRRVAVWDVRLTDAEVAAELTSILDSAQPTPLPTQSPTASPTVSPTVPGPINALNLTAVTADFLTKSAVSLEYDAGVGRAFRYELFKKGCEVAVNDTSLVVASHDVQPKDDSDSLQELTLTYDFNLTAVENSDIYNSTSTTLEVCSKLDMMIGPHAVFTNEQEIIVDINLEANFSLNVALEEALTQSANDTVDYQNAVRGYKCNGGDLGDSTTFVEDLTELAPNEELDICIVSNDATIEIERLENMESKQGDAQVPIVALGSPVVAAITSVVPPSGPTTEMVVSTRLPLNEFTFANGQNLTISGSVLLQLASRRLQGDRQLRDSIVDDGPEASAFQVQVVLKAENGFGPGDEVPLGSSAGHATSKYAPAFGLISIVTLILM